MLAGLDAPASVIGALRPLLLLALFGVVATSAWQLLRSVPFLRIATELDARADLKEELQSACWFASRGSVTAWEALVLARAERTLACIDVAAVLPVRPTRGPAAAVGLGAFVLALGMFANYLGGSGADAVLDPSGIVVRPGAAGAAADDTPDRGSDASAPAASGARIGAGPPPPVGRVADGRDTAAADGQGTGGAERSAQASSPPRDAAPVDGTRRTADGGGPIERALALTNDVARGLVERVQSFLGTGGQPPKRAELGEALSEARSGGPRGMERQDAQQAHTTSTSSGDPMPQLPPSLDGDRPMPARAAPEPSSEAGGRATISGGADGMRVDMEQTGDDGEDAPPEAPLSEPGTLQGRRTERLGTTLDRLAAEGQDGARATGANAGFYSATEAQAARTPVGAMPGRASRTAESAMGSDSVPIQYRSVVKQYFLNGHGRER